MKHIFIIFSVFVLLFPFQQLTVQAETQNNIVDYKEFDSFQKRYNEHLTELVYFIGTSYDSNDHYFKERMQDLRDAANEKYDSQILNSAINAYEGVMHKPIALLSVVSDLKKSLIGKIKDYFVEPDEGNYVEGLRISRRSTELYVHPPEGYMLKGSNGHLYRSLYFDSGYGSDTYWLNWSLLGSLGLSNTTNKAMTYEQNRHFYDLATLHEVMTIYYSYPNAVHLSLVADSTGIVQPIEQTKTPIQISNVYNRTVNNFNDGQRFDEDYEPIVTPQLVCPNETIDIQYDGDGVFYTQARQLQTLLINPDETVNFNGVTCNLDFKFPSLEFDSLTGDITSDGETLVKLPSLPVEPPEDYDYSLLGYIRNSYDYATSVIATGVNGLKSIIIGTSGLVAFSSSIFGFLPPEFVTLFVAGFSVALGLWVFKR